METDAAAAVSLLPALRVHGIVARGSGATPKSGLRQATLTQEGKNAAFSAAAARSDALCAMKGGAAGNSFGQANNKPKQRPPANVAGGGTQGVMPTPRGGQPREVVSPTSGYDSATSSLNFGVSDDDAAKEAHVVASEVVSDPAAVEAAVEAGEVLYEEYETELWQQRERQRLLDASHEPGYVPPAPDGDDYEYPPVTEVSENEEEAMAAAAPHMPGSRFVETEALGVGGGHEDEEDEGDDEYERGELDTLGLGSQDIVDPSPVSGTQDKARADAADREIAHQRLSPLPAKRARQPAAVQYRATGLHELSDGSAAEDE